jgi:hypothetical protein
MSALPLAPAKLDLCSPPSAGQEFVATNELSSRRASRTRRNVRPAVSLALTHAISRSARLRTMNESPKDALGDPNFADVGSRREYNDPC